MATLTPPQIADDLNLSVDTVLAHLKAGLIPGFQIVPSGPWRIDADAYREWIAAKSAPLDPNRIEPRSARSTAALSRRRSA